ncbi:MAG: hypothetical protein WAV82_11830 [Methylobacter sp.]
MSTFPGSPKLIKGGIVLIDPRTSAMQRIITLQYNPDSITRSLQVQGAGEGGDQSEALRIKGPPVETIKLEAELDLTDQLEFSEKNSNAVQLGLQPQLAALETLVYPLASQLITNNGLAQSGILEIMPMEMPLALLVWSVNRVLPVRLTEFSITEEAFDVNLNPIRAKVSLGMRVLSVTDLGFTHKGGNIYMAYHQQKERFAAMSQAGTLGALGLRSLP